MSLSSNLANNMQAIKDSRNLSLTDFAGELCISRSCLQDILKGERNVQLSTINQIASRLNINAAALLQPPYSQNQLSNAILLLEALEIYRCLTAEDRETIAELFHRMITMLDKAPHISRTE